MFCDECGTPLNPDARAFVSRGDDYIGSVCTECYSASPLWAEYEDKRLAMDGVYHPRKGYTWSMWSDSQVWMDLAKEKYEFPEPNTTSYEISKNNVALTCAGFALEAGYKALLLADGRSRYEWNDRKPEPFREDMPYTHEIRVLHNRIRNKRKAALNPDIEAIYGGGVEHYLDEIDRHINHPYRRYSFLGARVAGGIGGGYFPRIGAVHEALMRQVERAWDELQSEYSASASELQAIAARTPAVYDSYQVDAGG